jgi:chromosome segregation ATPase
MKKGLFGYKVSEVDVMMNTLREENESLNATITTLKTQIKNSEICGAKANLLEDNLKSMEENLAQLTKEKSELLSQTTALSTEAEASKQQNADLMAQIEHLHMQNEDLNRQITELQQQIADTSLLEDLQLQLDSEKEYKAALEQAFNDKAEKLTAAADELASTKAALETVTGELNEAQEKAREYEKAQKEIKQLEEELAITRIAVEEQEKITAINKKQLANRDQTSEISYWAYYNMSKMRNEVVEYIHEQMKEYYQFVNEASVKMHTSIEQRQSEYNRMIREFFATASEFRTNLSNIEDKYSSMVDYRLNTDKIANRMDEIMNNFIEEADTYLKKEKAPSSGAKEPNPKAEEPALEKEESEAKESLVS